MTLLPRSQLAAVMFEAVLVSSCADPLAPRLEAARMAVPALSDRCELCVDVREVRACWGAECGAQGVLVPRPSDVELVPPSGHRCSGQGRARVCEARAERSGAFTCSEDRCEQKRPRAPDNREWDCVELGGAVICRSIADAAGIAPLETDPAYLCGSRQGAPDETICIDLAPDPPPIEPPYVCRFDHVPGRDRRVCQRGTSAVLGTPCGRGCARDARCVEGFCLPARPQPGCWLSSDCGANERCAYGSCVSAR